MKYAPLVRCSYWFLCPSGLSNRERFFSVWDTMKLRDMMVDRLYGLTAFKRLDLERALGFTIMLWNKTHPFRRLLSAQVLKSCALCSSSHRSEEYAHYARSYLSRT